MARGIDSESGGKRECPSRSSFACIFFWLTLGKILIILAAMFEVYVSSGDKKVVCAVFSHFQMAVQIP